MGVGWWFWYLYDIDQIFYLNDEQRRVCNAV